MKRTRSILALSVILVVSFVAFASAYPAGSASSSTTNLKTHIGIFAQISGLFDQTYTSSMVQKFYNVVFGTGIFNSMEVFAPTGYSYSNTLTDTLYTQQVIQLAQLSEQQHNPIEMLFIGGMNLDPSTGAQELEQLQNFLTATQQYPEVYSIGINWERSTWGCDNFSTCALGNQLKAGVVTPQQINQAVYNIQNMVQKGGKQFISYYAPPSSQIVPPSGQLWPAIGNTGFPLGNPDSRFPTDFSVGYWTIGWYTQPDSRFDYIGISNGLFTGREMPDPVYYANISGEPVSSCALSSYNGQCGPGGQWSNVTVNWFFQQEAQLYSQYPSSRQFLMLGGDILTDSDTNQFAGYSGPLIDSTLPVKFWNSALFQSWVQSAEQEYGFVGPSSITLSSSSSSATTSTTSSYSSQTTSSSTSIASTSSVTSSSQSLTNTTTSLSTVFSSSSSSSATASSFTSSTFSSSLSTTSSSSTSQTSTDSASTQSSIASSASTSSSSLASSFSSSESRNSQTSINTTIIRSPFPSITNNSNIRSNSQSNTAHTLAPSNSVANSNQVALTYGFASYEIALLGSIPFMFWAFRKSEFEAAKIAKAWRW